MLQFREFDKILKRTNIHGSIIDCDYAYLPTDKQRI
jgi:hypothetical protein